MTVWKDAQVITKCDYTERKDVSGAIHPVVSLFYPTFEMIAIVCELILDRLKSNETVLCKLIGLQ